MALILPYSIKRASSIAVPVVGGGAVNSAILLNLNGANGGTTFTNTGADAWVFTAGGGATTSTTQKKFGSASMSGENANYVITSTTLSKPYFDSNWTLEFWWYPATVTTGQIFVYDVSQTYGIELSYTSDSGAYGNISFVNRDSHNYMDYQVNLNNLTTLVPAAWVHIAIVFEAPTYSIYTNGTRVNTGSSDAYAYAFANVQNISISPGGDLGNPSYLDDFRFSTIARYSGASFTPPSSEFTVD